MNPFRLSLRAVVALLLPAALLSLLPDHAAAAGVRWTEGSFQAALDQAKAQGKPVLLDLYATWCGPCHKLDAEVFPTEEVASITDGMIAMRIDAESEVGIPLVERYHVVGYPTVLLLRGDGTEIDRVFGFLPATEFANALTDDLSGKGTLEALREQVKAAPDDLELLFDFGFRASVRGLANEAEVALQTVIQRAKGSATGLDRRALMVLGKYHFLRGSKQYAKAVETFIRIERDFPGSSEASEARVQTVVAYLKAGNGPAAAAAAERAFAAEPDAGTANAIAWFYFRERRELETGIAIARRGLELAPKDAGLRDTLAELLAANGDLHGAATESARAQADEPTDPYYAKQANRFAAAAAAAP